MVWVGTEIVFAWPLISPHSYFLHQSHQPPFYVYADRKIDSCTISLIDEVTIRLKNNPLFITCNTSTPHIFLCYDRELYASFAQKIGKPTNSQGFHLQPLHYSFISLSFIKEIHAQNLISHRHNILEGSPSHIIAHELMHGFISSSLGYWKARKKEEWKIEGYCEYAASVYEKKRDEEYSLSASVNRFFNGYYDDLPAGKKYYIQSSFMVEYLLEVEGMTFWSLMKENRSEDEILERLHQWASTKEG